VIAARRKLVCKDFTLEGLRDPHVLQLAEKVTGGVEPKLAGKLHSRIVEITTRDGKRYSKQVDFPYGNPKRPISKEDLVAKFKDCISYSAKPLSQRSAETIIAMIDGLEELEDVGQIVRLLG
jgi:2-methylcitrate dehydratase PrpD